MRLNSTLFLKSVLIFIAAVALIGLLWFPHLEGRNKNADLFDIYFKDPFLAYAYIASTSFFAGIYQALKLLGFIEKNKVFSKLSVSALRNIKFCAVTFGGFIAAALPYMVVIAKDEDNPGVVVIWMVVAFASIVIAAAAGVFQKLLQKAVDIKSENDLTV